ncbi:hypothetical protein JCM30237_22060 [Halolamina litorea]|uniref:CARDB protein n=1 Tax=Halolamina litorea TaxID=1515593 RepID=A0ABD6BUF0_9EURY|nr:hypothetical protein [Halolamina litorea]
MPDSPTETDRPEPPSEDEEIDRRRLIRWIAVLAFGVPIVVELLTFGGLLSSELLPGGEDDDAAGDTDTATATDRPDAVGVGDELLPDTAAAETIETSELQQREGGRTYVLRVAVQNGTDSPVELRTRRLRLRDGDTVDGVSSTGSIEPGTSRSVTAAWAVSDEATPDAVEVVATRDGETVADRFVPVERPPIVG